MISLLEIPGCNPSGVLVLFSLNPGSMLPFCPICQKRYHSKDWISFRRIVKHIKKKHGKKTTVMWVKNRNNELRRFYGTKV